MKAVNLIPEDERRGGAAARLSGLSPVTLGLLGALLAAVVAVSVLVLLGNAVAGRRSELDRLRAQGAATQRAADALAPYAQVARMRARSVAAVRTLADARYDWPRLLDQVSRRVPADVKLTSLTGDVGSLAAAGAPTPTIATAPTGPAGTAGIRVTGCTTTLRSLARLMDSVRQIDGVAGVTLGTSTSDGSASGNQGGCPLRRSFDLTLALTGKVASS